MKKLLLFSFIILCSCTVDKSDIHYGEEVCSHCHMVIMDVRYGAELVTEKGKVYKFDAIECLINFKIDNPQMEDMIHSEWTNVHDDEATLFNASACVYLRSTQLPSPMGMYLNAFKDVNEAEKVQEIQGGTIYTWEELNSLFTKLPALNLAEREIIF